MEFWFDKPKSKPKKDIHPHTSADADKLARAINDAITGTLITNDARVVELYVIKRYSDDLNPPGVRVTIQSVSVDEIFQPLLNGAN
jgi:Holliday junction resolvase RusA-like endonuclease